MAAKPIGKAGGLDVYRAVDEVPADSLAVMAFNGEAVGAIPNDTRVAKINSEPGDSFPDGTQGTVLASALVGELGTFGYYVAFDPRPLPCFIAGYRIKEVRT